MDIKREALHLILLLRATTPLQREPKHHLSSWICLISI